MRRAVIALAAALLGLWPAMAFADSASVVCDQYKNDCPASATSGVFIGVGDTTLHVSGAASPGAFVIIQIDGAIVGSLGADTRGIFDTTLVSRPNGIHNVTVFAKDVAGIQTAAVTRSINILEHFQTDLEVVLPPSFGIAHDVVVQCQPLMLYGYTLPGARVQLNNDYGYMATVTANADGSWFYRINSANLRIGYGRAYVFASLPDGRVTPLSPWRVWRVKANTGACNPLPTIGSTGSGMPPHTVFPQGSGGGSLPGDNLPVVTPGPIAPPVATPFLFASDSLHPGQTVNLLPNGKFAASFHIQGTGPYWITIDWGDGITEVLNLDNDKFVLKHHYDSPGRYKVTILGADAAGNQATINITMKVTTFTESAIRLFGLAYFAYGLIVISEFTMRRLLHRGWA